MPGEFRERLEAAVKALQQEHMRRLTHGYGGGMATNELAEFIDRETGHSAACEALESVKCWCQPTFKCARCAALAVARGQKCEECNGTGQFDEIEDDIRCDTCGGTGKAVARGEQAEERRVSPGGQEKSDA